MKLKEIHRTSTFAWSPLSAPLLATGTVAGALDESFSNDSQLEIWTLDFLNKQEYELGGEGQPRPRGSVSNSSRSAVSSFLDVSNVECFPCQVQSYRLGQGRW